jgi:hypothetical protein
MKKITLKILFLLLIYSSAFGLSDFYGSLAVSALTLSGGMSPLEYRSKYNKEAMN